MITNKILWLDDDFRIVLQDPNFVKKDSYENASLEDKYFDHIQRNIKESYPQIELVPVTNVEDFKNNFDDSVVLSILDVKGCENTDEIQKPDTKAYYLADAFLARDLSNRVIVFSGNIDEGDTAFDLNKSFGAKGWAAVSKKETECYKVLLNRIKQELEDYVFIHFTYISGLCQEGVFNHTDLKILSEIVRSYQNKEWSHTYLNAMRTTLASLFEHFIQIFSEETIQYVQQRLSYKKKNFDLSKHSYNNIKELITFKFKYRNGDYDYNAPYLPYSACPMEIKHALNFLWEFVNVASHQREFTLEYEKLFHGHLSKHHLVMTYEAFFLVLEWFYIFFSNDKSKEDAEMSFLNP